MGRPLRFFKSDTIYFITGRCLQARMLLRPYDSTNAIIGGVLGKALARFDNIELYAFVFASNHFHMLLKNETGKITEFMQYVRSNIARKIGKQIDWNGKFWDRRYDAEPVLDDDALKGRLRYIFAHGVKEGLVSRCHQWPGLSSLPELVDGAQRQFVWPKTSASNTTKTKRPSQPKAEQDAQDIEYPLRVTLLPCYQGNPQAQQIMAKEMVAEIEAEYMAQRQGKGFLGRAKVLAQHPHDKPQNSKRSPRPLCHASSVENVEQYKAEYEAFAISYAEASQQYRKQMQKQNVGLLVKFPLHAYLPPIIKNCDAVMQSTA